MVESQPSSSDRDSELSMRRNSGWPADFFRGTELCEEKCWMSGPRPQREDQQSMGNNHGGKADLRGFPSMH